MLSSSLDSTLDCRHSKSKEKWEIAGLLCYALEDSINNLICGRLENSSSSFSDRTWVALFYSALDRSLEDLLNSRLNSKINIS